MNTQELKRAIEAKVIEIKEAKKVLRQSHDNLTYTEQSNAMYGLWKLKAEIRAMYLVYGWFRARPYRAIETPKSDPHQVSYFVKKLLDNDDHYKLYLEWLKSTA